MVIHISNPETDALVRELAVREGVTLTEAVKRAVTDRLASRERQPSLHERLRKITATIASHPETGLKAHKEFFDDLSGI